MDKGRLEVFSDGVIAIVIAIMVLELDIPENAQLVSLSPLMPILSSYVLSFIYLGIYWRNHHHIFQAVQHVDGKVLWANLHLLFLAIAHSLRHGMDGRVPVRRFPGCLLRHGAVASRDRLLCPDA